jgi:hypothetical protein
MQDMFEGDAKILKYLKITNFSCIILMQIIDDITTLSQIKLKSFTFSNQWFDIRIFMEELCELLRI